MQACLRIAEREHFIQSKANQKLLDQLIQKKYVERGEKYGRLYEIRNRYQLASVHAWGTTAFRKKDVEKAIAKYDEEQGKAQQEAYYTCFDIMQKYGLGKTQVRRFAETHGVCIKKAKGGRANLYLKADWEAARKKAEKTSASTKAKRT